MSIFTRPERSALLSNGSAFLATSGLAALLWWSPPVMPTPPAEMPTMEVSLDTPTAAEATPQDEPPPPEEVIPPEEPPPEEPPPPPEEPPPPPDVAPAIETPPPPPKPPEPKKEPPKPKPEPRKEPPKPRKPVDETPKPQKTTQERPKTERPTAAAAAAAPKASPASSASQAAQFRACLQSRARYPTSKEARLQNPHGGVGVSVSLAGSSITGVSITASSGSSLLDQAARSSILSSGCGSLAGGASSLSGRIVF